MKVFVTSVTVTKSIKGKDNFNVITLIQEFFYLFFLNTIKKVNHKL